MPIFWESQFFTQVIHQVINFSFLIANYFILTTKSFYNEWGNCSKLLRHLSVEPRIENIFSPNQPERRHIEILAIICTHLPVNSPTTHASLHQITNFFQLIEIYATFFGSFLSHAKAFNHVSFYSNMYVVQVTLRNRNFLPHFITPMTLSTNLCSEANCVDNLMSWKSALTFWIVCRIWVRP